MCGRKCRRNSICSLSLFSTLGEHLKRIIVLNLHNFLNTSAPDYFFSGFHSRLFFSGFNCSPKNVCTCFPENLSSAKKKFDAAQKIDEKMDSGAELEISVGSKPCIVLSPFCTLWPERVFHQLCIYIFTFCTLWPEESFLQDLYLHFCQCCPFSGMGDELTSGGNQNTELETFRRHSSKQS